MAARSRSRNIWRSLTGRDVNPFVSRRIKLRAPRVLHSHFAYVAVDDLGLARELDVPWVVSFYGADVYALGRIADWRARYEPMFRDATCILALGPVMATEIAQLGCPSDKIRIHPLGVDTARLPFRLRRLDSGGPLRVLFAGTFREKKGIPFALQAIAMLRQERVPVEFHLVAEAYSKPGDSETKAAALRLIEELGIVDAVVLHPLLAFSDLVDLALRCHVFVGPSVTAGDGDAEGTPFVLQQMMATGMPVIATKHSDIPYIFGELSGLLVPERDAAAIAARLLEYATNPALLIEHGNLLRSRISEGFSVHDCASRLCDLYDALAGVESSRTRVRHQ